jgi:hypothetical protein
LIEIGFDNAKIDTNNYILKYFSNKNDAKWQLYTYFCFATAFSPLLLYPDTANGKAKGVFVGGIDWIDVRTGENKFISVCRTLRGVWPKISFSALIAD